MDSIEFKFGTYVTRRNRTKLIDFGKCQLHSFFFSFRSTKKNSCRLWPMESNSLKRFNIQTEHSIELKFRMYITGCCRKNPVNFGKCQLWIFFFSGVQKTHGHFYITAYGVKFFKVFKYPNGAFNWAQILYVYYRSLTYILYQFWRV